MKLSQFRYELPEELIAKYPKPNRDDSRLMVVNRKTKEIEHKSFKDVMEYFGDGDLFVLNTGYEGFSHQLLEVMSVGMPVITTKIGGNPELVEDGKNGILVEYNNKEDLSKAIKTLFDDKNMTQKLADKARQKVKEFNQDKMISGLVRELTDI